MFKVLNEYVHPGNGQRHSLTLNDKGLLELTLFCGDIYHTYILCHNELEHKKIADFVAEIVALELIENNSDALSKIK